MAAAELDILIEQGATFNRKIVFKDENAVPLDLTGQTFRGKIGKVAGGTALMDFTCVLSDQITDTGEVSITLTAAQTATLPIDKQRNALRTLKKYAYDIERILPDGTVERILQGIASVSPEVTI